MDEFTREGLATDVARSFPARRAVAMFTRFVAQHGAPEFIRSDNGTEVVRFGLENGADQLAGWFPEVALHRRRESLLVTEADALVAYVRSTGRLSAAKLAVFEQMCAEEILLRGTVAIGTDVGMFEAVKEV